VVPKFERRRSPVAQSASACGKVIRTPDLTAEVQLVRSAGRRFCG
jgi:hypothetical protein